MMSSTNEVDPFLHVQQDVLTQLSSTRSLFASYLRIRSLSATNSPELASARQDLEASLAVLADDLADLVESVRAVESDPAHFGLDAAEVTRRRRLVQEVGGEVDDMREELARRRAAGAGAAAGAAGDREDGGGGGVSRDRDTYTEFEQQQQEVMIREQDDHLDGVLQTVGNLRRQADDMGRELEEQNVMIVEVGQLADRVGGRLATGVSKLRHIARRNEDTLSSCCIAVLIFVLIILLVLILIL